MIDVQIENAGVVISAFQVYPKAVTTALVRALNRGITSGRATMAKLIAADTGLKSSTIKSAMKLQKATSALPQASLGAGLTRIPLYQFQARQTRRGVSYRLPGSRGRNEHAFIAQMATGHVGVFMRRTKRRLPIKELFGPSLGHVFAKYRPDGLKAAEDSFRANFNHELDFATQQQGGAASGA